MHPSSIIEKEIPLNKRINKIRQHLFDVKPMVSSERCRLFTDSMKASEGKPIVLRRSEAFYDVLDQMTVVIGEHDLIVGNQTETPKSSPIYPEYSVDWLREELDGNPYFFDERPGDKFYITDEAKKEIIECLDYWEGKSMYEKFRKMLPDHINEAWNANVIDDTWVSSQGLGNVIVDYEGVVNKGLEDVIARIDEKLTEIDPTEPGGMKKIWFLQGARRSNEAVIRFAERIADACEDMANNSILPVDRKRELLKIAEVNRRVPAKPARNFHEAVQSIFTILLAVHLETNGHAISLGRFDQYVNPFYEKDVAEGILTREGALEIVESFFVKCNELNKLRSWPDTTFFVGYQMFINLAIAGQTADGKDATNTVSHLCVEACSDLKLFTPSVSVKYFDGTSDEFMLKALEAAIAHEGGQPAFYNDKAFMRTLENMGIAEEDRHNWSPDGCIEACVPGKWDCAAKGPWLNVLKVLEIALNDGVDPRTGDIFLVPEKSVKDAESTEEILKAYKKQLKYFIDLQVVTEHINDELHIELDPNPFRSSLIEDCIGRAKDLVEGGSLYSADGGPTAGSISAGDALTGIEYLVFDKKLLTMEELLHAMHTNFEDESTSIPGPDIRLMLLNKAPRYGNDDDAADDWVVEVENFIGSTYRYECKSSKYGKGPIPACFSYSQSPVTGNVSFGKSIGATPDGRYASEPVNNGVSPANGAERKGATAATNSVAKLPSIWFQKGGIFNMRLTKDIVSTEENRRKIIDMVKVFFDQYGQQIQFNVVDNETLLDAIEHPDDYRDLMVRVSGYSALFTALSPEVQMDLINRAELGL